MTTTQPENLRLVAREADYAAAEFRRMAAAVTALNRTTAAVLHRIVNEPHVVAGLEGRYYVRTALDPTYADPAAADRLIQGIAAGTEQDGLLRLLTPGNRARVAAAAVTGWTQHRAPDEARTVLTWHRFIGDTAITVGRTP